MRIIDELVSGLLKSAKAAFEIYTSTAKVGAQEMPEYFLPAFAFTENAKQGREKSFIFTLETNNKTIMKWYNDQIANEHRNAPHAIGLAGSKFDMVVFDARKNPPDGKLFALVEYKKSEYAPADRVKVSDALLKLPEAPYGIVLGRVYGEDKRTEAKHDVESAGGQWTEQSFDLEEGRESWLFAGVFASTSAAFWEANKDTRSGSASGT